ncbi:SGNH/GDSL hydrolase family protein [bacterium]|nr:SGNH/GDSL hydrolase family protein [bacterium]
MVRPVLVVAGLVVGVALGELLLRAVLPAAADKYYPWYPRFAHAFRPDPKVVPGVSGIAHFTTNKWGLRGSEFNDQQDYRILAVGGSTTECLYLDDTEAWPHLVEAGLNEWGKLGRVWVGNAGRSGLCTREHVAYMTYLPPQYPRLDAAIFLVGANDLAKFLLQGRAFDPNFSDTPHGREVTLYRGFSVFPGNSRLEFFEATGYGRLWRRLSDRWSRRSHGGLVLDDVGQCYIDARQRRAAAVKYATLPDLEPALAAYAEELSRIIALCRKQAIRPVFMTQPVLWGEGLSPEDEALLWFGDVMGSPNFYSSAALGEGMARFNHQLLEVCRQHGVECIDLVPLLPRDTSVFYDDMHFNEAGSRRVAGIVVDWWKANHDGTAAKFR